MRKNEHGFSLIQIIVASAVLAVFTLAAMGSFRNLFRAQNRVRQQLDFSYLRTDIRMILNNEQACRATVAGLDLTQNANPQPIVLRRGDGSAYLQQGQSYGGVTVETLEAVVDPATTVHLVTLRIVARRNAEAAGPDRDYEETFLMNVANLASGRQCFYTPAAGWSMVNYRSASLPLSAANHQHVGLALAGDPLTANAGPIHQYRFRADLRNDCYNEFNNTLVNCPQEDLSSIVIPARGNRWILSYQGQVTAMGPKHQTYLLATLRDGVTNQVLRTTAIHQVESGGAGVDAFASSLGSSAPAVIEVVPNRPYRITLTLRAARYENASPSVFVSSHTWGASYELREYMVAESGS